MGGEVPETLSGKTMSVESLSGEASSVYALPYDAAADSVARRLDLSDVEVSAVQPHEAVVPAQRLEGARLQALSAHSVADAVRYFSGVQLKDYGGVGGMKTVDVRSMGTHHLGVFYDGIEVGNAQNGTVDLGKFSMDNLEEVSLYNGQKSEIFQPAKDFGSAGTLYLRTRRPQFADDCRHHLTVGLKTGSFGLLNPSVLFEQKLSENLHLSLNAEYTQATGRYRFRIQRLNADGTTAWDTTGIRQNGDIQAWRTEAGLFGRLPQGKWHVKAYWYQSEKGIPRAIIRNVWTSEQRQWDGNAFVQGNFTNAWRLGSDHTFSFQLNAKYSHDRMRYLNPDTTLMYLNNRFRQQEAYLSAAGKLSLFSWWDVALSTDGLWNRLDANLANFAYPQRYTGLVALATAFHHRWVRAQASLLTTSVCDFLYPSCGDGVQRQPQPTRLSPAVSVSLKPFVAERLYVRGFYKESFRMPTFNDLYYTDIGSISLQPEEAVQWDGGLEYDKQWARTQLRLGVDAYFNQIHNKIVAVPKGNSQYRWLMMNLGYVEIRGLDVNAGADFHPTPDLGLSLSGTYTYQRAQDFSDPTDALVYGGQISYIPWHSGSAIASASYRSWGLNYSFIYVGERYHNSANIAANREQPWYTSDLSVSKGWDLHEGQLSTTLEINNLLNQQYSVILNYPMPGTNVRAIVKYSL